MSVLGGDSYKNIKEKLQIKKYIEEFDVDGLCLHLYECFRMSYYDEKMSARVSQLVVQSIVDKLKNGEGDYASLLVELQEEFGIHNGGCLLYDYYPQSGEDIEALVSFPETIYVLQENREGSLNLGDDEFTPSIIYPVNRLDPSFRNEVASKYSGIDLTDGLMEKYSDLETLKKLIDQYPSEVFYNQESFK